jgi:CHAT domain-containing protein
MGLNGLANLYKRSGLYEKAESIYKESLSILEKALGQDHHDYAMVLKNLANLYFTTNQLDRSEYYYKEALPKYQSILGNEHQDYIQNLYELSLVYWATGKHTLTQTLLLQSESGMQSNLIKAVRHLSEIELSTYHGRFVDITDYVLSLASIKQEITPESYNAILFHKGFILNTSIRANKLALKSPATNHNLLKSYHRRLAAEYAKPTTERKNVAELEEKANTLEKELVRTVAGYGEAIRQVNWQEVQSALKPGEAAIEFVRFHYYTPKPTDSVLYAALILTPGMSTPVFVGLFEEKQLDALLAPQAQKGSSGFNELYGGVTSRTLYRLLWAPLEAHLAGVKTVYFSPAGQLYRLNIGAIANPEGKTLSDRFQLVRLNSTRQLVESSRMEAPATAVVFGGIRFDMDSTAYHTRAIPVDDKRRGLSFEQSDSTLRGGGWQYLKWSDKEADNVGAMLSQSGLSVTTRKGWDATEEAFKQLGKGSPSPRILHLSTHGFFFPDPERDAASGAILADHEPVFKISDHPMIRSGLVLAGGNHAWRTGKPLGEREDGILTAYEISQMDLSHTELVVLSACETGLGQIEGNEGVYGLQRAFKIAGAKNLVMSLWQVPDYQTQELMSAFYRNLTEGKMAAREALQAAQNEMRQKRYEPYYWAGFILVE